MSDLLSDLLRWSSPEYRAEYRRYRARMNRAERLTNWMERIPVLGQLTRVFWFLVLAEGDLRDGLMFSFLNDGFRPTLWHTVYSVTHDNMAPYSGIYPNGAPKNRQEAERYK